MGRAHRSILIIAGLDPGGGAGLLADVAACNSLGFATAGVATCLTVQSLRRYLATHPVAPELLAEQLRVLAADHELPAAVKIGMLPDAALVEVVADWLAGVPANLPVVCDPVLRPSLGDAAVPERLVAAYRERLLPSCTVLTPNLPELELLLGHGEPAVESARQLLGGRLQAVLVKGGHGADAACVVDHLISEHATTSWRRARVGGGPVHGTGCALASCLAAQLADARPLTAAVGRAIEWLDNLRQGASFRDASAHGRLPFAT